MKRGSPFFVERRYLAIDHQLPCRQTGNGLNNLRIVFADVPGPAGEKTRLRPILDRDGADAIQLYCQRPFPLPGHFLLRCRQHGLDEAQSSFLVGGWFGIRHGAAGGHS
ncbi:MAG: hypothetical protein ABSA83_18675 [Verrucomicrobiota bacterium]